MHIEQPVASFPSGQEKHKCSLLEDDSKDQGTDGSNSDFRVEGTWSVWLVDPEVLVEDSYVYFGVWVLMDE